jgi:hypothetical protein
MVKGVMIDGNSSRPDLHLQLDRADFAAYP